MENIDDCIVCARSFHNPNQERITCSQDCKEKWRAFMEERKTIPDDQKQEHCDKFFGNFYRKMIVMEIMVEKNAKNQLIIKP